MNSLSLSYIPLTVSSSDLDHSLSQLFSLFFSLFNSLLTIFFYILLGFSSFFLICKTIWTFEEFKSFLGFWRLFFNMAKILVSLHICVVGSCKTPIFLWCYYFWALLLREPFEALFFFLSLVLGCLEQQLVEARLRNLFQWYRACLVAVFFIFLSYWDQDLLGLCFWKKRFESWIFGADFESHFFFFISPAWSSPATAKKKREKTHNKTTHLAFTWGCI